MPIPLHASCLLVSQGRREEALQHIDEAIAHTPTVIELYITKAKILKHAGDLEGGSMWNTE